MRRDLPESEVAWRGGGVKRTATRMGPPDDVGIGAGSGAIERG